MIAMLFNITTIRSISYNYSINKTQAKYYQNKKREVDKNVKRKIIRGLKKFNERKKY